MKNNKSEIIANKLKTILETKSFWILSIISSLSFILIILTIKEGHNWDGDFSLYIHQAKAMLSGDLDLLYESNKFTNEYSQERLIGPHLYPHGFPVLLTLVYPLFGMNFIALKIFCSLFLIASIPLLYSFFKDYFDDILFAFIVVLLVSFNYYYIRFCDTVGPDIPYFFISLLSLFLIKNVKEKISSQLFFGFILFYAYFMRDIGITLIFTHFIYQLVKNFNKNIRRIYFYIPYGVFIFLLLLSKKIFPYEIAENHWGVLFSKFSFHLIITNIQYYIKLIPDFFIITHIENYNLSFFLGSLILFITLIGIFKNFFSFFYLIAYIGANIFILVLWPAREGARFIFPIIPFVFFFFIKGICFCAQKIKTINIVVPKLLIISVACFVVVNFGYLTYKGLTVSTNGSYTSDMKGIYSYVSSNIPSQKVVAFFKPRVLRLFSDDYRVIYSEKEYFDRSIADYLLIKKSEVNDEFIKKYTIKFNFSDYLLIEKK